MARLGDLSLAILVALVMLAPAAVLGVGAGYVGYLVVVNDDRCASALGLGAEWDGGDRCVPPPVHVEGLR